MNRSFALRREISIQYGIGQVPSLRIRNVGRPKVRGVGALAHDPEKPLREEPTIVNKVDLNNYALQINPLIESLEDDLVKNLIYVDIDATHAESDKLLFDATQIDGCVGPTGCAGWGPKNGPPFPKSMIENKTYPMRQKAIELWALAAVFEDKIKERGGVTKEQAAAERQLFLDMKEWADKYDKWFQDTMKNATIVKGSDFQTMQQYDVDLQAFRNRYRKVRGLEPSASYPHPLPKSGGIPWTPILIVAAIGVVAYALHEVNAFGSFFAPSPKAA